MLNKYYKYIFFIKFFFLFIGFSIFIFLYIIEKKQISQIQNNNITFMLDLSHSMNVEDVQNIYGQKISRLELAKYIIKKTIRDYPKNSYGLIIFGNEAKYLIPPTYDKELFKKYIETLSTNHIKNQGSNPLKAINLFNETDENNIGILLSDLGEETNTKSLEINKNNISIIGIGSSKGGYPTSPGGNIFEEKISVLNSSFGEILGNISGYRYIHIQNLNKFKKTNADIIKPQTNIYNGEKKKLLEIIGILSALIGII